ncbi:MAG: sodium/solute symporter [Gammaproteobacteria bacterium]
MILFRCLLLSLLVFPSGAVIAAGAVGSGDMAGGDGGMNVIAAGIFVVFIVATLFVTWWAATQTRNAKDFYAAGGRISGFQNGLAIAGDFMSAATFLGISGLVFARGIDAVIYSLSALVGLCLLLFMVVEPFRNLGRYTLSDIASYRLNKRLIRGFASITSLAVVIMYLITQMVGAGALIQVLFGLPYESAVIIIGGLMVTYVAVGGMMATTWVQIIKAVLMLLGVTVLAFGTLHYFDFSVIGMYKEAVATHDLGERILEAGTLLQDPVSSVSLAIALVFGFIGLPHILMRLFTVPDVRQAYRSVFFSSCFMAYVFILITFVIGVGAITILNQHPELFEPSGRLIGGNNMAAVHLSQVIAGDVFLGFISAIVFATILAVVAGLTLAGASAISHDFYAGVIRHGKATEHEEVRITRIATIALGIVAIGLGILFEGQNVAYLVSMVFAISASANFPLLVLSVYWRGLTSRGAVIGGSIGLFSAVSLIILGPTIWVEILGNEKAIFPYQYPALFTMPLGFISIILFSKLDRSSMAVTDRETFDELYLDMYLGQSVKEKVAG